MKPIKFLFILASLTLCGDASAQLVNSVGWVMPQPNQVIHYTDGSVFYGTTLNGKRNLGRLIYSSGKEVVGTFDTDGYCHGIAETTIPSQKSWYKGNYNHGNKHGAGSLYKNRKYYDQMWSNGELKSSTEVRIPSYQGENYKGCAMYEGSPSHPFYGQCDITFTTKGSGVYYNPGIDNSSEGTIEGAKHGFRKCHSCLGSGRCKFCHGTGVNTHDVDDRCGVCKGYGTCVGCNGNGGESY